MFRGQRSRPLDDARRHAARFEVEPLRERRHYGLSHVIPCDCRLLRCDVAGGGRVPLQAQRLIDRSQHRVHPVPACDDHDPAHVGSSPGKALSGSDQFVDAAGVHAIGPRTILAGYLTDAGVDSERAIGVKSRRWAAATAAG